MSAGFPVAVISGVWPRRFTAEPAYFWTDRGELTWKGR